MKKISSCQNIAIFPCCHMKPYCRRCLRSPQLFNKCANDNPSILPKIKWHQQMLSFEKNTFWRLQIFILAEPRRQQWGHINFCHLLPNTLLPKTTTLPTSTSTTTLPSNTSCSTTTTTYPLPCPYWELSLMTSTFSVFPSCARTRKYFLNGVFI